jgi:hypothetical protein
MEKIEKSTKEAWKKIRKQYKDDMNKLISDYINQIEKWGKAFKKWYLLALKTTRRKNGGIREKVIENENTSCIQHVL